MKSAHPIVRRAAAGALLLAGCAHTPLAPASAAAEAPPAVVITGSRLPQRLDLASGLPATTSAVVVRTRQQLEQTGAPDLGTALRLLTP